MQLAVYVPLLLPVLLAVLARPISDRLHPQLATWLLTAAAVVLAACATLALGVLAASAAMRIPLVASLGRISMSVLGPGTAYQTAAGALAVVALGAGAVTATVFLIHRCRGLADAYSEARQLSGLAQPVVLDDKTASAYAVPGRPGRIVVTAGMLDALDDAGRAALLAHERAHLAGFHHLYTSAARLAAAVNPLLRPAAQAVEYTVERWADEEAAQAVGERRLVAHAIGRAALAATPRQSRGRPAVLGAVFSTVHRKPHAGPIPRRVAALLAPAPPRRLALLAVVLSATFLAGACALIAANDLQDLLALASGY